ncbi:D-hexose-6-phosphate mutarotase [Gilvimarinus agarilyticus]|uniref:D-hexose-6-phosphate mutarotase n=1 Tax=Gilvimarinus agarilyticus TaxID=679259 RepID=UPI00059F44D0|nr:D-hexose-6-phosphate mutarotase [Gilvimarinus agarilyticus]
MPVDSLRDIIARCDFLTLTDSATRFPDRPGQGLPLLAIDTPSCQATIALNGAQLLSFTPTGGDELLWVSPNCDFSQGASLRGGIPLCLPWFGPHPSDSSRPNHGIVRTQAWDLLAATLDEQGRAVLTLGFSHEADAEFEYDFNAELTFTLGETPTLELALTNNSRSAFSASWVMHTYFAISDISRVQVEGLDGREYADKVAGGETFSQCGPVSFSGEVDRVYQDIQSPVTIDDGDRRLSVAGDHCPSVVVWNTGAALAAEVGDIGPDNHTGYVCVERGACLNDTWQISVGETRRARMSITPC